MVDCAYVVDDGPRHSGLGSRQRRPGDGLSGDGGREESGGGGRVVGSRRPVFCLSGRLVKRQPGNICSSYYSRIMGGAAKGSTGDGCDRATRCCRLAGRRSNGWQAEGLAVVCWLGTEIERDTQGFPRNGAVTNRWAAARRRRRDRAGGRQAELRGFDRLHNAGWASVRQSKRERMRQWQPWEGERASGRVPVDGGGEEGGETMARPSVAGWAEVSLAVE